MPTRPARLLLAAATWAALPAAARPLQSAVAPFGPAASEIATLWWVMLIGGVLIFIGVIALVLLPLLRAPRTTRETDDPRAEGHGERDMDPRSRAFIIGGGIVFPGVVLSALLVYTVAVGARLSTPAQDPLVVQITGYMWWWEVRYQGAGSEALLVTANELRIPVGRPVQLALDSGDVIHSFWVPNLAGKTDMIPGRTNRLRLQADAPGTYRAQCAEFCGLQHAQMALHVVAEEAESFDAWFAQQRQAQLRAPDDALLTDNQRHGRAVFERSGCGGCHSLHGVSEAPRGLGPDLTHVGSRPSLAAGMLPNNAGTLGAWIAGAQQIKPGSKMPSFHTLSGRDLTALTDYLASRR